LENTEPIINFTAEAADANKRLDIFLSEKIPGHSRSRIQHLIGEGNAAINGTRAKASAKLNENDHITLEFSEPEPEKFEAEEISLDIVYEDEYLAVINKPAGMVVHPGAGNRSGTLANAVAHHFKFHISNSGQEQENLGSEMWDSSPQAADRVGIVHRLDKFTSGLIVVAKTEAIHEALSAQFRKRSVEKMYVALVHGEPRHNSGIIDRPIARDRWHRTKMSVAANGRNAVSHWKVRRRFNKFALIEVEIKTGRTHQIRVHLASINHPVVGDETYNEGRDKTIADIEIRNAVQKLGRFFLHAERLAFDHPVGGERLEFICQLSPELAQFLELL
jgi:23S rRNA pseudouridine1911/1915/1917 synthase